MRRTLALAFLYLSWGHLYAQTSTAEKIKRDAAHNTKVVSKEAGKNIEYVAKESGKNIKKISEKTAKGVEKTVRKIDADHKKKQANQKKK